jgi:hypothetical protein
MRTRRSSRQCGAAKFLHISSDYWHENMTALAERIAAVAPMGEPVMSFFCQSGTEAVEGALKLARYVTGRQRILAFLGSFHGRTMGSLALTSSKVTQQVGFAPVMPGVTHVPYPNSFRPLFVGGDQGQAVLDYIRMLFERNLPPAEIAAIVVEPIQGEGGYLVPPDGFLAGLRQICDEHGIFLVFDEVQTGVPQRQDVCRRALGRGAGHHDARQGPGFRYADRRRRREAQDHAAVEEGRARQHLRRQPAVLCGGECDARPGARPVRGERGEGRRPFHGAALRTRARLSLHRGCARPRPDDRHRARQGRWRAEPPAL